MKKILLTIAVILVIIIAGAFIYVSLSWNKTFDAPLPEITAIDDSAAILRDKHLAYGRAHCVDCHGSPQLIAEGKKGAICPMTGGLEFTIARELSGHQILLRIPKPGPAMLPIIRLPVQ